MLDPSELANRIKVEVIKDVETGIVPVTVATFSELHDYVDANLYGGTEAILDELSDQLAELELRGTNPMQEFCMIAGPAFEMVDAWIKAGGIRKVFGVRR